MSFMNQYRDVSTLLGGMSVRREQRRQEGAREVPQRRRETPPSSDEEIDDPNEEPTTEPSQKIQRKLPSLGAMAVRREERRQQGMRGGDSEEEEEEEEEAAAVVDDNPSDNEEEEIDDSDEERELANRDEYSVALILKSRRAQNSADIGSDIESRMLSLPLGNADEIEQYMTESGAEDVNVLAPRLGKNEVHLAVTEVKSPTVYVKDTGSEAGNGLFARRSLRKGSAIAEFGGPYIGREAALESGRPKTHFIGAGISNDFLIDGRTLSEKDVRNNRLASYSNSSSESESANARVVQKPFHAGGIGNPVLYLVAKRDIAEDEEIMWNYNVSS